MDKNENNSKVVEQCIGWAVLLIVFVGAFLVVKPFLSAALWAGILTFSLWPVNRRLAKWLRGRRVLAALITTLGISLVLLVPFVVLGFNLAGDIHAVSSALQKWSANDQPEVPAWIGKIPLVGSQARQYWTDITGETAKFIRWLNRNAEGSVVVVSPPADQAQPQPKTDLEKSRLAGSIGKVVVSARTVILAVVIAMGRGVIQFIISLLLTFFFLCDGLIGDRFTSAVTRIGGQRGKHLLKVAGDTVRGVIYGIIGTAIAQGVVAGIGFAIAGVPGPVFLGLLTFFLSPLPIGPPLVWIPASIWLFAHGWIGWGIFMLIWGIGVSTIDNFLKPWLISQGSQMPFILIFFGVIGGALAFGFIGIFLGPSLLAVTYCLVQEWFAEQKPSVKN